MNPQRLRLQSYRTFEQLDLELPHGCLGVVGANGAGKSSVIGAIEVALFGPSTRSLEPFLTEGAADPELMVELTFEHDDEVYRVRRGYSGRGRGKSTLDLERDDLDQDTDGEPSWIPLTQGSAADTQALIEATLRMTRETFRASVFLAQGDGAAFTEAAPKDRKRILANVLGLDVWERACDGVRATRRATEKTITELDGRVAVYAEQLAGAADARAHLDGLVAAEATNAGLVETLEAGLDAAAAAVERLDGELIAWRDAVAAANAARERAHAHARLRDEAQAAASEAENAQAELAVLPAPERVEELQASLDEARRRHTELLAGMTQREQLVAEAQRRHARMEERLSEAAGLKARADDLRYDAGMLDARPLDDTAAVCDRCEQHLGGDSRQKAIASMRAEADDLDARAAGIARVMAEERLQIEKLHAQAQQIGDVSETAMAVARVGDLERDVARLRADATSRARLEERIRGYQATIAKATSPDYIAELDRLEREAANANAALAALTEPEPGAADHARAHLVKLKVDLTATRTTLEQTRERLAGARARVEHLDHVAAQHKEALDALADAKNEAATLGVLERAFGRDGVPAWIVEHAAIPQLEAEATRILGELGGPVTRVELRTERELKDGSGTTDALDIVCVTDAGERDYTTFSGGEKTRVNLALRIALARLLAHRRGANSRLLAIDEPEFLDEAGTARLVDVLRGLTDFDRVYLTSHQPVLRDAFEQALVVTRENGRSEAVLA